MNRTQAKKILAFDGVPRTREGQEEFIRTTAGYTSLNRRPLYDCSKRQINAVAYRLWDEATEVMGSLKYLAPKAAREQAEFLYEIFNIPKEERKNISPSDLEKELLY